MAQKKQYIILANINNGNLQNDLDRQVFSSIKSAEKVARAEFSSGWKVRVYDMVSHNVVKQFEIR